MKKDIFRGLAVLVGGIILATVAMILVYMLPTDRMVSHVQTSLPVFEQEGGSYDNSTDSLMLLSAIFHGDAGLVDKAMNVYGAYWTTPEGVGISTIERLIRYARGEEGQTGSYARYWHGYLLLLKPLLLIMSYPSIRSVNLMCQMLLIGLVFFMLFKRSMARYAVPVFLTYISLSPAALSMSMECSFVFYIAFLAVLLQLLFHEKIMRSQYRMFFLLIGMSTSFLDFLTYPLITYGLPIVLYILLQPAQDRKQYYGELILLTLFWGVGYVGMWAGKWIVATLLTGSNIIQDAIRCIRFRTSMGYNDITWTLPEIYGMKLQQLLSNRGFLLAVFCSLILCGVWIYQTRASIRSRLCWVPVLLIAALSPFVWYAVASNHSAIHYYAYRTLAVSVFAVFCLLIRLGDTLPAANTSLK